MFSLKDKKALVTGAGSGIGAAIAEAFAKQGAFVWVVDRDEKGAQKIVEKIRSQGGEGDFYLLDVTSEEEAQKAFDKIGVVDILVNNAGVGHVGSLSKTTVLDLDKLYSVNVRGVFNICKAFIPKMMERGCGSVINMASVGGIVAVRDRLAYTTTKFAVVGMTKALALDHSHTGVRFNCICPGRVETEFVQNMISQYPDPQKAYQEMASTQLNGRMAKPEEVAAAAVYLAAEESSMVSGSCLMLESGWTTGK
jgi:2-keto-3-deoxy-L-fuconate dehydrogenase